MSTKRPTKAQLAATNSAKAAAAAPAPAPAPVATPAPAPAPTVALRGGLAVAAVLATGKVYRTAAKHNADWWQVVSACTAGGTAAGVADLIKAGVPSHFIGYTVRRGYLKAAPAAPAAE